MVKQDKAPEPAQQARRSGSASLDSLNRTLHDLEMRLSRLTREPDRSPEAGTPKGGERRPQEAKASGKARQVTRAEIHVVRPEASSCAGKASERAEGEAQPGDEQAWIAAAVGEELQRLRLSLQGDLSTQLAPRLDGMRESLNDLRTMICERESADKIDAEIRRLAKGLEDVVLAGAGGRAIQSLRDELDEMRGLVSKSAREDTVQSVGQRWQDFETRFSDQSERETEAKRKLQIELERLREALGSVASEDHIRAVEKKWDDFETRFRDQDRPETEAMIARLLGAQFDDLRAMLKELAREDSVKAVEEKWSELEERFATKDIEANIQRLAERMGEIEHSVATLPESLQIGQLEARVQALAASVEKLTQDNALADQEHFKALEERLDEISRAIVAAASQPEPVFDMAPIDRLEARMASLTERVDGLAEDDRTELLSQRIGELATRIDAMVNDSATDELTRRMEALSERFEAFAVESTAAAIDISEIEARLVALTERLEEAARPSVDEAVLRSLEEQIRQLTSQLASQAEAGSADMDERFGSRLASLEQRVEENQEAVLASARAAADEMLRRIAQAGEERESEHIRRLSDELKALEQLSRENGRQTSETFAAVQATLMRVMERLDQMTREEDRSARAGHRDARDPDASDAERIERVTAGLGSGLAVRQAERAGLLGSLRRFRKHPAEVSAAARPEPGHGADVGLLEPKLPGSIEAPDTAGEGGGSDHVGTVDAPPLDAADEIDAKEANRLLEPGSGTPDIAALLAKVRAKQAQAAGGETAERSDFIAAARRAAMAAAAEAEALSAGEGKEGGERPDDAVGSRRKPIMMAVTAVLLALMAVPVGRMMLADDARETASLDEGGAVVAGDEVSVPQDDVAQPADLVIPASRTVERPQSASLEADTAPTTALADSRSETERDAAPASIPAVEPAEPLQPGAPVPDRPSAAADADSKGTAPEKAAPARARRTAAPTQVAEPVKAGEPAESREDILARAVSKLPPAATGDIPDVPEGIGPAALVTAAENGNPKALFEIGLRLVEGRSGASDPAEALVWFGQSAMRTYPPAQYSLGTLYEKGTGTERDTAAARDWYRLAADAGNVRAMHNLAVLYATGIDGRSQPEKAVEWFEKAAMHGMKDSQYNLGILYARGAGVDQNLPKSYEWFSIVAESGDMDAAAKAAEVAKSLDEAALKAAKAKVAAFHPKERVEAANTVDIPPAWTDAADKTASVDMTRVVRNVQAILSTLGFDAGAPDGIVGEQTIAAITAFQKAEGLEVTGKIDEALIRALLEKRAS